MSPIIDHRPPLWQSRQNKRMWRNLFWSGALWLLSLFIIALLLP